MSTITTTSSRIIPSPIVTVTINGRRSRDVEVEQIKATRGMSGKQALLSVPRQHIEEGVEDYDNAEVVIRVRGGSGSSVIPIFRGWIDVDRRTEGGTRTHIALVASSVLHRLNRLFVGQQAEKSLVEYSQQTLSGEATDWKLSTILRDLFADDNLPLDWRGVVALGNIDAIRDAERDITLPDIEAPSITYHSMLRHLLSFGQQIQVRERYDEEKTRLDFYRYNDSEQPIKRIKMPLGDGPEEGAFALSCDIARTARDYCNRVIGYGGQYETMVTVTTDPTDTTRETIKPAWPGATAYAADLSAATLSAAEQEVIEQPGRATPGRPEFRENRSEIFRLFRLPESIRRHRVLAENIIVRAERTVDGEFVDEQPVPLQFFRQKYSYAEPDPPSATVDLESSAVAGEYELLAGAKILPGGYILLAEPLVYVHEYKTDGSAGKPVNVYRRVHLNATISIAHKDKGLKYDTGVRGTELPGLETSGSVDSFRNSRFKYQRVGTEVGELTNDAREAFTYGALWFDEDAQSWTAYDHDGTPDVIANDSELLAEVVELFLTDRNYIRTEATVTLPGVWNSYQIGDIVRVTRRGIDNTPMQIHQIVHSITPQMTTLQMGDGIPVRVDVNRTAAAVETRNAREQAIDAAQQFPANTFGGVRLAGQGTTLDRFTQGVKEQAEARRIAQDQARQMQILADAVSPDIPGVGQ